MTLHALHLKGLCSSMYCVMPNSRDEYYCCRLQHQSQCVCRDNSRTLVAEEGDPSTYHSRLIPKSYPPGIKPRYEMLKTDYFSPWVVKELGEIVIQFICFIRSACLGQAIKDHVNPAFPTNLVGFDCLGGCFCFALQSPENIWPCLPDEKVVRLIQRLSSSLYDA